MDEEEMEDVSLDEKAGKEKEEVKEVVEEVEGVEGKEDQVLSALGNIGRWQVQIIMITGYNFRSSQCNHIIRFQFSI